QNPCRGGCPHPPRRAKLRKSIREQGSPAPTRAAGATRFRVTHKITLISRDGIGTEGSAAVVRLLGATGPKISWETVQAGAEAYEKYKEYIPKELTESIERTHVALKGPITTPVGGGFASINVQLRKKFDLYANFRPVRNLPHIPTRYPDVDLVIVRENTEGIYSGIEHEVVPGVVESLKLITDEGSTRIARFDFVEDA